MFPSPLKKRKGENKDFIVPVENPTTKSVTALVNFLIREQGMLETYCWLTVNENEATPFNKDFLVFFMLQI